MILIRFGKFIEYENQLTEVSNSLMALLAGSKLASHLLILNEGSTKLLPEVFPKVEHIQRFSLTSEKARGILEEAERHLGTMGTPYILALHEDFMNVCINFVRLGIPGLSSDKTVGLSKQHALFQSLTGSSFSADSLNQLDVIRCMRNCIIHNGGRVSQVLIDSIRFLSAKAVSDWNKLADSPIHSMAIGDLLDFGHSEMILTLAITKKLAKEANVILQTAISREVWADLLIQEMIEIDSKFAFKSDALRKVAGLSRHRFGALALSDTELRDALTRHQK